MAIADAERIVVEATAAGGRLDAFVHALGRGLSRRDARELCNVGGVAVGEVRADASVRLRASEVVAWRPRTASVSLQLGLSVAAIDDDVIVLEKPPHLAVHAGPLVSDSVAARLQRSFPDAGLAHRLDRGASGLLLIGRSKEALRALAAAMATGTIARDYLAVVHGEVARDAFTIDLPLRALDEPRGDRPKVVVDREAGQPARTQVEVRARRNGASLLAVRLETGRTHQVRAHLAAVGHPLLGDPRYGDAAANTRAHATFGIDRPLLHAVSLAFPHPDGGERLDVTAWHEQDFARVFPQLRHR